MKIGGFAALHSFSYTTRANISHEKTEQIRARIVCTPAKKRWAGVDKVNALTEQNLYILFCLFAELGLCLVGVGASTTRIDTYAKHCLITRRLIMI